MRKPLVIQYMTLHMIPFWISLFMRKIFFAFLMHLHCAFISMSRSLAKLWLDAKILFWEHNYCVLTPWPLGRRKRVWVTKQITGLLLIQYFFSWLRGGGTCWREKPQPWPRGQGGGTVYRAPGERIIERSTSLLEHIRQTDRQTDRQLEEEKI